jgi:hypothetical protein
MLHYYLWPHNCFVRALCLFGFIDLCERVLAMIRSGRFLHIVCDMFRVVLQQHAHGGSEFAICPARYQQNFAELIGSDFGC